MQCYTELVPPTGVTHAVSLPFLDPSTNNLIIAKTSLLQIFRCHDRATHADSEDGRIAYSPKLKLSLVGEYPLAGTVTSLAPVKALNTKSGADALLIAFRDAKLSLIEWDPDNYRISTISIHYYEGENVTSAPFGPSLSESENILTVDPSSRCAALKFAARNLAILPFRQSGDDLVEGAEDGFDTELDIAPPSSTLKRTNTGINGTASSDAKETPYQASFVLPLTALDPSLTHPVHLAFLHEYREPTFGILSASLQPSYAMLEERKDILSYTVFTLDLEQRASTNLVSVQKLPSDLWKVVPLPLPVGGALLVGVNQLVHVDQSGRTNAVAVNEFAKLASGFNMTDQSALNMKLENCEVELLDSGTGDTLIVLSDGALAILSFRLQGRNVGDLTVTRVHAENGGAMVEAAPSSVASLDNHKIFVASEDGDSTLLAWTKPTAILSRKRSHAQMLGMDTTLNDDENGEDLDDDDLYAPAAEPAKRGESFSTPTNADSASSYNFEMDDRLPSLAPINSTCFGRSSALSKDKVELLAATGRGRGSRLAFMSRQIIPEFLGPTTFKHCTNVWALNVPSSKPGQDSEPTSEYDNVLCVYDGESTRIYDIINTSDEEGDQDIYSERSGTEFENEGETLFVSTIAKGTRLVQCRRNEIRTYDASDFALSQIIPMIDEETDAELKIVHVSFCDPYLLVLRDDSSVLVLRAEQAGDIEPLELEGDIKELKWLSGCLYGGELFTDEAVLFLLGDEGGLHVFRLPDLTPAYSAASLSHLPAVLSVDAPQRRVGAKETLTEILFTDLGNEDLKQPYLILRSALDDLILYEPWRTTADTWDGLRFRKVPFHYIPKFDESITEESDERPAPLQSITIAGRSIVYVHGGEPTFIIKEACSLPKALGVRAQTVKAITRLNHKSCRAGFGLIDSHGKLRECQFPRNTDCSTGWAVQRVALGDPIEEIRHVSFHDEREIYVVATCRDVDFYFAEDDRGHPEQDDITLRPQVPRYTLHLLSANTRTITHSFEMPYLETVTSLKVIPLEVSEQTHEQKAMVVAGTGLQRGEDMPAKGAVYVFEILKVVPDPDRPESEYQLHVAAREETKGAITALEPFPGGLVGTGQGQKIMVRGLKEDGSCLPVAFLDVQCYTIQLKSFANSGMFIAGDAWKGLWFGGFTEEPYKLSVLGKSRTHMEVVAAEFLPFDGQLYILIVDAEMDLHVLQYDPENPKSISGTRLLHRSTIHTGHFPSNMTLLPSTMTDMSKESMTNGDGPPAPSLFQILTTSTTGSIGLVTPLDEASYRRLGSIQTHLTSVLEHAAGLNPRAYREVESEGFGSRGIIDGSLVQRIDELGSARRAEVLGRAVADAWALRSDLEIIGGGGLGYL